MSQGFGITNSCARACSSLKRTRRSATAGLTSRPYPLACWIVERLGHDDAFDPFAEDLDSNLRAGRRGDARQICVGDRLPDRVAVATACHAADELTSDADRLRAERDRPRILERHAAESRRGLLATRNERVAPDELLVELHRKAQPRLVGRLVCRDVGAPYPLRLLRPQRVDPLRATPH